MTLAASRSVEIVPSLLSADLSRLPRLLSRLRAAGARWVTVDVMDGHFVPNLSFGPDMVRAVKRLAPWRVDAHLMVDNPETVAGWFVEAGADSVTFHLEAARNPRALLRRLRAAGVRAGVAVKPATPAARLRPLLRWADSVLVMTVEPGFGGARLIPRMLSKIRDVRGEIARSGARCRLQVDGGINARTAGAVAAAGAQSLVAGHGVFAAPDAAAAYRALLRQAAGARGQARGQALSSLSRLQKSRRDQVRIPSHKKEEICP